MASVPHESVRTVEQPRRVAAVEGDFEGRWGRDAAAWVASLGIHLVLALLMAVVSMAVPRLEEQIALSLEQVELPEIEEVAEEFFASSDPSEQIGALGDQTSESALASAPQFSEESTVVFDSDALAEIGEVPLPRRENEVFQGPEFSQRLPVQGVGSVGTQSAAGAIDRITQEILSSIEQRPTLVVWLFDQSGSLRDQRLALLERFRDIYDELGVIEASDHPAFRRHKDKPLLTTVLGFGAVTRSYTDRPTDRWDEIERAIEQIADDESGTENVFQAIGEAAEKHRSYRAPSQGRRHVMIVTFTDEAGDDVASLDATVGLCRKLAMSVYVVGPPAPFGRETAYVKWIDPDPSFDQRPQWAPVSLGPESLLPERLKLRSTRRNDDELLDSGFGPYGLTRLCYETGGLYFSSHPNRVVGRDVAAGEVVNLSTHFARFFDADVMRRYQPDYVSQRHYRQLLTENRARGALVEAARMSWMSTLENVSVRFPKRDEASLAEALSNAQRSAALLQPKIDMLCRLLLEGEVERERLKEPRWQAGYDLAMGSALAVQVRTEGYNVMLALAKQGMAFQSEKNNTWLLQADAQFANSSLERRAEKAIAYLQRVCEEHAGTPWALLASAELSEPLGWRWDETFTRMRPIDQDATRPRRPRPETMPVRPPRRNPPPL